MTMMDHVHIARRFLRSIRIDTDLSDPATLDGFICPHSFAEMLTAMSKHASETGQGAFTWTGPYGSGKSSLAVALGAFLNGNSTLQKKAAQLFGHELTDEIRSVFPTGTKGWRVVPVVGSRDHPVQVIGDALCAARVGVRQPRGGWTEARLLNSVKKVINADPGYHGGLIIFIDEMGKFLESAVQDDTDIYIFQQLAEIAARSNRRFLLVGILHQAFEEYAHRLSRELRAEWAKIQGRFTDLAVNTGAEEQIDLIARAIESDFHPDRPGELARVVSKMAHRDRPRDAERLALMLEKCWPLHPAAASLLGPISRRRFGQNLRSIFGFLNSAEPHGFHYFLRRASKPDLYGPDKLWDYLRVNLEPSILSSPDSHRWALAVEALERGEAHGGDALHITLLKTIAVIDLFKERSGLIPSFKLLCACVDSLSTNQLKEALKQLETWSLIIYKKHLGAYAIYAGSDFDIEKAVNETIIDVDWVDFRTLKGLAGLQPMLAKRHYHETGALRWFDVNIAPLRDVKNLVLDFKPNNVAIGQFLLAIPTERESDKTAEITCREAARLSGKWDSLVGCSSRSWTIVSLAKELIALEKVRNERSELAGDSVARKEVSSRLASLQGQIETELHKAIDGALWFRKNYSPKTYHRYELNSLASNLADKYFPESPKLSNELLNRYKPSSSAIAAQKVLLRQMVLNEGSNRLGIKGFPAEGGLFSSILESTRLYQETSDGWKFVSPQIDDDARLGPIWKAGTDLIRKNSDRTIALSEIYELWRQQPYGVKDGLMPVLIVAFILSQRDSLAIYREGLFRARFDDVDVDYLANDPNAIQLRWMDLTDVARRLLSEMAELVCSLDEGNSLTHLEPIDVARGLIGIFDSLTTWTKRTMHLSSNALRIRDLFKQARDPNRILFDDLPTVIGGNGQITSNEELKCVVEGVREGLEELVQAYPSMLQRLKELMLAELQVANLSPQSLNDLRKRADNIKQISGDFHLEAFVGRVREFDGSNEVFEGIASLAVSKPPRDWTDSDLDRAAISIAEIAQKFLRVETFARVKGRPDKRQAMAVVVGMQGRPTPLIEEFHVSEGDRTIIDDLIERVDSVLEKSDTTQRSLILAALAELSARYIQNTEDERTENPAKVLS